MHTFLNITVATVYLFSVVMFYYFKCVDSPLGNANNSVHRSVIASPNVNTPYKHFYTAQHKLSD